MPFRSACRKRGRPCSTPCRLREIDRAARSAPPRLTSTARSSPAFCSPVPKSAAMPAPGAALGRNRGVYRSAIRIAPGAFASPRALLRLRLLGRSAACRSRIAPQGDGDRSRQNRIGDLRGQPEASFLAADPSLFVPTEEMKARGRPSRWRARKKSRGSSEPGPFRSRRHGPSRSVCSAWLRRRDSWSRRTRCSRPIRTVRRLWRPRNR